ncbi:MAG: hypothetical protein JWN41_911 [Thermoleophilia bacterium]|nr:hypothetical protein [Thermoleophilia bacterium]
MTFGQQQRDALLDSLDRALLTWPDHDTFALAIQETVSHTGYAAADVEHQLRQVMRRASGRAMRAVIDAELGENPDLSDAPATVLVLAASSVPGLAIEGAAAAIAVGAKALVRPSRDETVLFHFLSGIRFWEPALAEQIEIVGMAGEPVPWESAEGAIVFGSDETLAFAREQLAPEAVARLAAYGSRQGIAVVLPGADVDASWAERLADDICMFRQRGCMSPSWLYVVGTAAETAPLVSAVGRELTFASGRHMVGGADEAVVQRHAADAAALDAIASGSNADTSQLFAGEAQLTVVRVDSAAELKAHVGRLGSLLQTAVIAGPHEQRPALAQTLLEAGCTRICFPGAAHEPDALWPHDGIGRVAPLLGRSARNGVHGGSSRS